MLEDTFNHVLCRDDWRLPQLVENNIFNMANDVWLEAMESGHGGKEFFRHMKIVSEVFSRGENRVLDLRALQHLYKVGEIGFHELPQYVPLEDQPSIA